MVRQVERRSRGGRRPKGEREPITARVPSDQKPVFVEAAARAGMPVVDYIAVVLARVHNLPVPDYLDRAQVPDHLQNPDAPTQLRLDFAETAVELQGGGPAARSA